VGTGKFSNKPGRFIMQAYSSNNGNVYDAVSTVWHSRPQLTLGWFNEHHTIPCTLHSPKYKAVNSWVTDIIQLYEFLPRDATQSAVMPQYVVRLSVCDVQVPW